MELSKTLQVASQTSENTLLLQLTSAKDILEVSKRQTDLCQRYFDKLTQGPT